MAGEKIQEEIEAKREEIAATGDKYWSERSEKWSKNNPPEGQNKCNIFVHDVLSEVEVNPTKDPMYAKIWGDKNSKIKGFKVVTNPRRGDIAAFAQDFGSRGTGHMGVMTSSSKIVYQSSSANMIAKTQLSNFGNAKWVYWRYVGMMQLFTTIALINCNICECGLQTYSLIRNAESKHKYLFQDTLATIYNLNEMREIGCFYCFPFNDDLLLQYDEFREINLNKDRSFKEVLCYMKEDNLNLSEKDYFYILFLIKDINDSNYYKLIKAVYQKYKDSMFSGDFLFFTLTHFKGFSAEKITIDNLDLHVKYVKLINNILDTSKFTKEQKEIVRTYYGF